jgi:hypothetical protein
MASARRPQSSPCPPPWGKITADSIYLSDIQATFVAPGSRYAGMGLVPQ